MRNAKPIILFLLIGIVIFGNYSSVLAGDKVSILEHSIKAVATVSSGRFIKIAWSVQVRNEIDVPMTCVISIAFLDQNKEKLGTANKTSTLDPKEAKTITDTVVLSSALAQRISSGEVTVEIEKS
jgi:hypothetical protein